MTEQRLLWLDLETTGLTVHDEAILAVGVIATDGKLKELARAEWHVNWGKPDWFTRCERPAFDMHKRSGLFDRCDASPFKLREVETLLKAFVLQHGGSKPYLSGSSIHFDRSMVQEGMASILALLHHRMLDVSTLRILQEAWAPGRGIQPSRLQGKHTPLADLEDSIALLRFYAHNLFAGDVVPAEVRTP